MRFIDYNKDEMCLHIKIDKFSKFFQCPFATWWKCRKYFKRPRVRFYFGPMQKKEWYEGSKKLNIRPQWLYHDTGFFYFVSYSYLEWRTSKWFPILMESRDISWKDKYDTPRYEHPGFFSIIFGRNPRTAWQFAIIFKGRTHTVIKPMTNELYECCDDNYWENMLWYHNYSDTYHKMTRASHHFCGGPDLKLAAEKYPWGSSNMSNYITINHPKVEHNTCIVIDDETYNILDIDISNEKYYNWPTVSSVYLYINDKNVCSSFTSIISNTNKEILRVIIRNSKNSKNSKNSDDIDYKNVKDIKKVEVSFNFYMQDNFIPEYLTKRGIKEIYNK